MSFTGTCAPPEERTWMALRRWPGRESCGEDGAMVPFAANMKKTAVDQYAEELLGLSYDQFRQIILLPQGQFERLLTADTEEKEKILRTLFERSFGARRRNG